jgi:hypothetical protein
MEMRGRITPSNDEIIEKFNSLIAECEVTIDRISKKHADLDTADLSAYSDYSDTLFEKEV